ncbi:hypothetical protein [Streptomyces sp. NRRL WC-3742]|uniref:hypothetical protein n=1 Tax=Streptomyces sp. NRRL WC-3742 TaxID=1463934 RepID=UPI0006916799|nr:hypothetical protein [Streptomyces sp. NRRL WC-3742]
MLISEWLTGESFRPGAELLRSDRSFMLMGYTPSHGRLLLRSERSPARPVGPDNTVVEVLFTSAQALDLRTSCAGLAIRCATEEEAEQVRAAHPTATFHEGVQVFVLESDEDRGYVVAQAVGWREGVLAYTEPSLFNGPDEDRPRWRHQPLGGAHAGFNLASAEEVVALLAGTDPDAGEPARRERYRGVHVVMTRVDHGGGRSKESPAGVFLTEADARDALEVLARVADDCWIETVPIAV